MVKCNVIGLGYIGLPTSLILANAGHDVIGVDVNEQVLADLKKSKSHIKEPEIDSLLKKSIDNGKFKVQPKPSIADVFIIAVPTPLKTKHGNLIPEADLSFVNKAVDSISDFVKDNDLVILESTSPVGTTEQIANRILKNKPLKNLHIAYCPERVLPGQIVNELISNDRVIGGITKESAEKCAELYTTFCKGELLITNDKTAEMIKLTENAFRDVNIAFANELSMICDDFKINTDQVISYANRHPRVDILNPGCGAGGHCIPIDPWFIASKSPDLSRLIQTARLVNDKKTLWIIDKIKERAASFEKMNSKTPLIGIFGLTFKPNVDDLRESPALKIFNTLEKEGMSIITCEPNIKKGLFNTKTLDELLDKADILVFRVAHSSFKKIDFSKYLILDFCGITK